MKILCEHELVYVSGGNALDTVTGSFVSSSGGSYGGSFGSSFGGSYDESYGESRGEMPAGWGYATISASSNTGSSAGDLARMDRAGAPVDFCGSESFNAPESLFGVYQGRACQAHDVCYADAVVPRATCDSQFLTNLQDNCGSNVLCQIGSLVYYGAVRIGGGSSYATPLN